MRRLLVLLATVLTALASAQSTGAQGEKPAGVEPAKSVDVALGYARNYAGGDPTSLYYKLTYRGDTLLTKGTEPRLATPGGTFLRDFTPVDDYDLKLNFQDGVGALDGPLANLIGLRPFRSRSPIFDYVRATVQASAKLLRNQQYNVGAGLETVNVVPYVPLLKDLSLSFLDRRRLGEPAKVLRLGVIGEHQSRELGDGPTKDTDTLQLTYRAYLAYGFAYRQTRATTNLRNAVLRRIDALTVADLKAIGTAGAADANGTAGALDPLYQVGLFLSTDEIPGTPERPRPTALVSVFDVTEERLPAVKALLRQYLPAYTDQALQPTFNVEARAEGSYAPVNADVRAFNNLYTVGLNVWINPTRPDDGKLFLGYQNGYSRGALGQALTGFVATFGFRF